ncbi:MAG: glycosyltransferase [Actinomycetota bacterium]|nr:glycosyltransferase [Actinomycetota bacterium]
MSSPAAGLPGLDAGAGLLVALLSIAALLVVLAGAVVARRASRRARVRRLDRLVDPLRPLLIELAAADEPDPELLARLDALDERSWRQVEVLLAALLGKVRGDALGVLVQVLERRARSNEPAVAPAAVASSSGGAPPSFSASPAARPPCPTSSGCSPTATPTCVRPPPGRWGACAPPNSPPRCWAACTAPAPSPPASSRTPFAGHAEAYANPLAPPVSLLVPAHDEELTIAEAVGAMLSLRYPAFEVVVCDDGSRDATFERLRAAYDLVEVSRVLPGDVALREELLSVYVPADGRTPLVVGRTANAGRAPGGPLP